MAFMSNQATMNTSHSVPVLLIKTFVTLIVATALWFAIGAATAHGASVVLSINGSSNSNVQAGSNVTLSWQASGVTNCTINNGVGAVPNSGTRTVTAPTAGSVVYTIACSGGQTSTVTVSVKPYVDLYTTPAQVSPVVAGGQGDVTVNWNAINATKCTTLTAKNNASGATRTIFKNATQQVKGKYDDKISANTTYTLTCVNAQNGQSDTESQAVSFVPFGPPQITSFSTNKGTSAAWDPKWAGVNMKVNFQSTNAQKCIRTAWDKNGNKYTLSGWTAENLSSASTDWVSMGTNVTIADDTTFRLRCGRPSTNDWVERTLVFDVTNIPAGGAGAATNLSADIFAPDTVSVPQASNLPARVQVETKVQYANRCTYRAFNSSNSPITVNGWTTRTTGNDLNSVFPIYVSQGTTRLQLQCTRTSDGATVTANHTITTSISGSGGASNLDLSATAIAPANNVQRVRLDWTGQNVSSCTRDDVTIGGTRVDNWFKSGTIPLSGVYTVSVFADTVYSLTCINAVTGARVTDTVTVLLNENGDAEVVEASAQLNTGGSGTNPTVTLKGDPNPSPAAGTNVTLTWTGANVTSCTLTGGGLNFTGGASGSRTNAPNVDTTYTVNCTGPNGPASDTELVTIGTSNTPSVDLTITNPSTGPGDSVTLEWEGENVTSCTLTGGGINVSGGANGTQVINPGPSTNTTYTVNCTGPNGPANDDEIVTIPTLNNYSDSMDIEADPIVVRKGNTTQLTWFADPNLTSQTSCVLQANGVPITGALTGAGGTRTSPVLDAETTFSIACAGVTNPPAEASVRVRVLPVMQES